MQRPNAAIEIRLGFRRRNAIYTGLEMILLECIPNFSEGRHPEVLDRLTRTVHHGAAVRYGRAALLDYSADTDHHRTVLTLAGRETDLLDTLMDLYRQAMVDIDLRQHHGVHPRIGALDVCPFVPLGETDMATAVRLAERLGQRVGDELGLPVYLYGEAARSPDRRQLAEIRRGGIEALTERISQPEWRPDYGPAASHPSAGATAIGARFFLIAFNVLLDCADPAPARRIAARVREAGGGLPAVKALGLPLVSQGKAQVSMNLVDYRLTSPHQAFARVAEEAARLGVTVLGSEIIGLVPRAALEDGPLADLQLVNYSPDLVLENRLEAAGLIA